MQNAQRRTHLNVFTTGRRGLTCDKTGLLAWEVAHCFFPVALTAETERQRFPKPRVLEYV